MKIFEKLLYIAAISLCCFSSFAADNILLDNLPGVYHGLFYSSSPTNNLEFEKQVAVRVHIEKNHDNLIICAYIFPDKQIFKKRFCQSKIAPFFAEATAVELTIFDFIEHRAGFRYQDDEEYFPLSDGTNLNEITMQFRFLNNSLAAIRWNSSFRHGSSITLTKLDRQVFDMDWNF